MGSIKEPTLQDLSIQLSRVEQLALISAKSILDLDEAMLFTGFSRGHLYRLTSEKKIPHYKKKRKLFFKKSELEEWLLEDKVLTSSDINRMAEEYTRSKR